MERLTIKDIARKAGVSITTVSRVLNNKIEGYMREETKQKVMKVITQLGYRPDPRARSLRGLQSGIIGVILPEGTNPFYQELAHALTEACYKEGYGLLLCNSENDVKRELFYIELLQNQKVDGIIISTDHLSGKVINHLISRGTPMVLVDEDVPDANAPAVFANNYQGACLATQYLIDLGHHAIAFIKGPMKALSCRERYRGYYDTLLKNGIKIDEVLIGEGDITYKSGYKIMKKLLKEQGDKFTAVFCSNDFMALGAMRAIQVEGKKIPDDYSIVGFDNVYVSSISNPQLTTVAQPINQIARKAFRMIKNWAKKSSSEKRKHEYLDTKLIIRESCKSLTGKRGGGRSGI